jgi:hypothetical protein
MAAYNYYDCFAQKDLLNKIQDLFGTAGSTSDTLKIALTNRAPVQATDAVLADIVEIAAGNGYSAGGASVANVGSGASGTFTLAGTDVVFTASGPVGPFQYAVLYNATVAGGALIAWWARPSPMTMDTPDTFTVDFGANIFTVAHV